MTNYREILRLLNQGISQRSVAASCDCSRSTVQRTIARAEERGITWPLPAEMTDEKLRKIFSPPPSTASFGIHKEPDCEKIHREMSKRGVTLSLLWNEYSAECRGGGDIPLMYTQFCKRYRDYAVIHKATMHIERKPGEQMEVDWAGQTMELTDNITGGAIPVYIFQKKPGSRQSVFLEYEQPLLQPLPDRPFELSEWKICVVAYNYHISVDKMFYSVPYEYIKQKVDVRLTRGTMEVFLNSTRIASHVRKYGHPGQYTTIPEHMPEDHRKYTHADLSGVYGAAQAERQIHRAPPGSRL